MVLSIQCLKQSKVLTTQLSKPTCRTRTRVSFRVPVVGTNSSSSAGGHLYAVLSGMSFNATVAISDVCVDRYLVSDPFSTTSTSAGGSDSIASGLFCFDSEEQHCCINH